MKLIPISAGNFHCDGGALFSVIQKNYGVKCTRLMKIISQNLLCDVF